MHTCEIKQMKEMTVVARLFITCTCTLLPLRLEGEQAANNIENLYKNISLTLYPHIQPCYIMELYNAFTSNCFIHF